MIIDEPKVIAQKQDVRFKYLHIEEREGELFAIVHFYIFDENGKQVDSNTVEYSGEEFHKWWNDFNSGKYLYEKAYPNVQVPDEVEEEFSPKIVVSAEPIIENLNATEETNG